jgi:hypothetical protein
LDGNISTDSKDLLSLSSDIRLRDYATTRLDAKTLRPQVQVDAQAEEDFRSRIAGELIVVHCVHLAHGDIEEEIENVLDQLSRSGAIDAMEIQRQGFPVVLDSNVVMDM